MSKLGFSLHDFAGRQQVLRNLGRVPSGTPRGNVWKICGKSAFFEWVTINYGCHWIIIWYITIILIWWCIGNMVIYGKYMGHTVIYGITPSGKHLQKSMEILTLNEKFHYKWPCSIAILNYQRVTCHFASSVIVNGWDSIPSVVIEHGSSWYLLLV